MEISALVLNVSAFCKAFLGICVLKIESTDPEEGLTEGRNVEDECADVH